MDYAALAKQHGGTPLVDYVTLARKFGGAALESKPVHHASDDVEALRASAERQAPKIGDAVASAAENVPGAEVEAVRDSKDSDRIEDKAERQGVQPSQVGDIAAAKVTVPDQPAAQQVLENLHQQMPVESAEGKVTGEPGNNSVRQTQAIVDTKAPAGEPVKKAEVILQTPEMTKATDKTHDDYREAQELRSQGKEAEARQLETEISRTHEAAEHAAQERTNESTDTAKEKGSTHGASADPSSGRSTQSPEATREKEKARAPGSAPIPIAVRRVDDSKAAQAANPAPAQPVSTESSNKADRPVGGAATPAITKYKFGNTQANIPADSEAAKALDAVRARIPDGHLAGAGKNIGDSGNHVTVRYGIQGDDTEGIKRFLSKQAPFEASLGKTSFFPPTEHSDGAAVIVAPIQAPELHRLNAEIEKHGDFSESSFPEYRPHATVAYVNPDQAHRYIGLDATNGKKFTVDSVAVSKKDGSQEIVKMEGQPPAESTFDAIKGRLPELQDKLSTSVRAPKPLNNAKKNPDIGIDFDGTLFTEESDGSIGKPIPERIASAKRFLDEGKTLEIISRRATRPEELPKMRAALKAVGLGDIPITDQKNADMLFDNSAHHAPTNANTPLSRSNNARKEKSDA